MSTLMHLNIHPVGEGESLADAVSKVIKVIDDSGMAYEPGAMGTTVEGRWPDCLNLIDECRTALADCNRLRIEACFDIRETDEGDRLHRQVEKVKARPSPVS